ncbi:transporter substrate-binding domain-containing protein [Aerococcaceae bacterium zg-ZJ1578]|uniref:transporter substrate-binding domain-containing protein n=1 Tax=Aerococcaceae bacterium zg-252 TaxID=2796928 RepID=UPI001A1CB845|nr:transporter substrate-binding domain-containing protein [Aerococcaceae bacterium zg-1578]MBR7927128.1 transporter substrate-binding domain-containing protein [Aerococcaceae bacterium zg-ZUI334]MBS4461922.1 transporter substrate-binding domain-containing protein [Aerococcaceae bacterium zg-B36]
MKKLMTLFLALLVSLAVLAPSAQAADNQLEKIKEKGTLVVGTSPDFPPREFYIINDKGEKEIVGSDISLAKAIADKIGVKLELVTTDFNGVIANIQTGTVDLGISGFSWTQAREEVMDFSVGYSQETGDNGYQGLLVSKETADKFKTLDELKAANLTIGAQGGSIQYELALQATKPTNVKQYGTLDAAVLALNAGDIQAMVVSTSSAEPLVAAFDNLTILPRDAFDLDPENKYANNVIGLPKNHDNADLLKVINEVIETAIKDGTMEKWETEAKALSTKALEVE